MSRLETLPKYTGQAREPIAATCFWCRGALPWGTRRMLKHPFTCPHCAAPLVGTMAQVSLEVLLHRLTDGGLYLFDYKSQACPNGELPPEQGGMGAAFRFSARDRNGDVWWDFGWRWVDPPNGVKTDAAMEPCNPYTTLI